ncbi:MAG: type II toxin-antitoxin system RelE/ParE family toxin [Rivularia sp. (in: Bacteria)]|nr:type II toxin-antitoxin system RelE/ParE family toxin [Rivularia sp. MS3]
MNTEYLPGFLKDIKTLKSTPYFESIKSLVFEEIPLLESFEEVSNLKKLTGYDNTYRIRVGNYRIGLTFDGDMITFYRVLHRKDFYRYFPSN